jgi:hypothetical protein
MVKLVQFLKEIKTILIKTHEQSLKGLKSTFKSALRGRNRIKWKKRENKVSPKLKVELKISDFHNKFYVLRGRFWGQFKPNKSEKVKLPKYELNNEMDNPTLYLILNLTFCLDMSGSRAMSCGKNFSKVDFSIRFRHSVW